jgi:hypothetical protein
MYRIIAALFLLLASAAASSAQGLFTLRLAEWAGLAPEGFGSRPCYGKFHRSFHQRPGGLLSGSSL